MEPQSSNARLRQLVRALKLDATEVVGSDGYANAWVRYPMPFGVELDLRVSLRVDELRFLLRGGIATPPTEERLRWALQVNDAWGVGQVHLDEAETSFDASVSVLVGQDPPPLAREALAELVRGVEHAALGQVPQHVPWASPVVEVSQIAAGLTRLGYDVHHGAHGDVMTSFVEQDMGVTAHFAVYDERVLYVRGTMHPRFEVVSAREGLRAVHALNRVMSFGSVALRDGRYPNMLLPFSSQWHRIDDALVRWAIHRVAYMVPYLRRTLPIEERG